MPSVHYFAESTKDALFPPNFLNFSGPSRTLSNNEKKAIKKLACELEKRTYEWITEVNSSGEWRKYYFREWHDGYGWYEPEPLKRSSGLYLRTYPYGLYHPGYYEKPSLTSNVYFGFTNLDDIEANFRIIPFIMEYVRRLSMMITDLVWLFEYEGNAFFRGRPLHVKKTTIKLPPRTVAAKDQIPEYVKNALGHVKELPLLKCEFCGKSDSKVTPQFIEKEIFAHERCLIPTKT
ncbi:MAG: hypothetical protein ACPLY9_00170 [Nitrososphaerales archaeon]